MHLTSVKFARSETDFLESLWIFVDFPGFLASEPASEIASLSPLETEAPASEIEVSEIKPLLLK